MRQMIANRIVQYFEKYGKTETVKHFVDEGENRVTVYEIIKRYQRTGTSKFAPKSGRPRSVTTGRVTKAVKYKLLNKNATERGVAAQLGLPKSTVHYIKVRENIMTNKCTITPNYKKNQSNRGKTNSRKVYRKSIGKVLILDDETYVTCDTRETGGQEFFNFIDKSKVPDRVRFRPKSKFPLRYLVWQAIDE